MRDSGGETETDVRRKYDLEGVWSVTATTDLASHIAFSSKVGLVFTASFNATLSISPSGQSDIAVTSDDQDSFDTIVAQVAPDDARTTESSRLDDVPPQMSPQIASAVAIDAAGKTIVGGSFRDTLRVGDVDLAPGPGLYAYVLALDGRTAVWSHVFPIGRSPAGVQALAADASSGRVFVAGSFDTAADLGCGALDQPSGRDGFAIVLDGDGTCVHQSLIDGAGDQDVFDVAPDGQGGLVLSGTFEASLPPGLNPSHMSVPSGQANYFVGRFDASGNPSWARPMTGSGQGGRRPTVATDAAGRAVFASSLSGTLSVGSMTIDADATGVDTVVALFSAVVSGASAPSPFVAFAATGDVVVLSPFASVASLDGITLTANGDQDLFLAVLDQSDGHFLFAQGAQATSFAVPLRLVSGSGSDFYVLSILNGQGSFGIGTPVVNDSDATWNIISKVRLSAVPRD